MSKKSGSENRQRQKSIGFRANEAEYEQLKADAARAGLSLSDYARSTLLNAPVTRQVKRPPIEVKALAALQGQIGRVGNNINQIARLMNSGLIPPTSAVTEELAALKELRLLIKQALGKRASPHVVSIKKQELEMMDWWLSNHLNVLLR